MFGDARANIQLASAAVKPANAGETARVARLETLRRPCDAEAGRASGRDLRRSCTSVQLVPRNLLAAANHRTIALEALGTCVLYYGKAETAGAILPHLWPAPPDERLVLGADDGIAATRASKLGAKPEAAGDGPGDADAVDRHPDRHAGFRASERDAGDPGEWRDAAGAAQSRGNVARLQRHREARRAGHRQHLHHAGDRSGRDVLGQHSGGRRRSLPGLLQPLLRRSQHGTGSRAQPGVRDDRG